MLYLKLQFGNDLLDFFLSTPENLKLILQFMRCSWWAMIR